MMFAGTSGVDSQMDMMHPMAADFRRSGFSSGDGGRRVSIGRTQFADTANNRHVDATDRPTDRPGPLVVCFLES